MTFFIKVANSNKGSIYRALCVRRYGVEKAVTFDIEAILLISGLSMEQVYKLPLGCHDLKI